VDLPADQSTRTNASRRQPPPTAPLRSPRRRRPSGEAPPLPHHLHTTGVGWLVASVVLIVLSMVVFAGGLRGPAVAVTVLDDTVVRRLAGLDAPWLVRAWEALAFLGSWWVLNTLGLGLLMALLALRRFRHLILALISAQLLTMVQYQVVGPLAQRPRPFGVDIRAGWGGWALPSIQVANLAATLVVALYTLVPEGRWRQRGKLAAAGVVTLAEPPTWTSPAPVARPSAVAWRTSWGSTWPRSSRSGSPGRPARPRCGSRSRVTRPATSSASCTLAATSAPTAGTSSAASCCTAA
jgi:hypothetical protein